TFLLHQRFHDCPNDDRPSDDDFFAVLFQTWKADTFRFSSAAQRLFQLTNLFELQSVVVDTSRLVGGKLLSHGSETGNCAGGADERRLMIVSHAGNCRFCLSGHPLSRLAYFLLNRRIMAQKALTEADNSDIDRADNWLLSLAIQNKLGTPATDI